MSKLDTPAAGAASRLQARNDQEPTGQEPEAEFDPARQQDCLGRPAPPTDLTRRRRDPDRSEEDRLSQEMQRSREKLEAAKPGTPAQATQLDHQAEACKEKQRSATTMQSTRQGEAAHHMATAHI